MEFRRRICENECFKLGYDEIPYWFQKATRENNVTNLDAFLENVNEMVKIKTLEGTMTAIQGDFIIKGVEGEIYPCKPEVFRKTYDPIPMRHIAVGDNLAEKIIYLDEAHYLGEDAGDIIVIDEDHKIYSTEREDGLVDEIILLDKNEGVVNTMTLYKNGERLVDKVLVPQTFTGDVTEIDIKKTAYEFIKIEIEAEPEIRNFDEEVF